MNKRYYKVDELVWLVQEKTTAKIVELDIPNLSTTVLVTLPNEGEMIKKVKFNEIDKIRDKTQLQKNNFNRKDTVLFAKVCENAIIPSKDLENSAYDIYACKEVFLKKGTPNFVSTGLAISLLSKYGFNIKTERGSTGKLGMCVLSGQIDSGYRGEIFINIVPLYKDIHVTSTVTEVVEYEDKILFPITKAIAQGRIQVIPDLYIKEITYEEMLRIPSKRMTGKLGSSGK
jgi:dUTP pyrophosphatase